MFPSNVNFAETFTAKASELKVIRAAVKEFLQSASIAEDEISDIILATDEACQNIIRHAYKESDDGTIDINVQVSNNEIVVILFDYAEPVDPNCCEPKQCNTLSPGGLGNLFINKVMDSTGYQCPPLGVGNKLVMKKMITKE
ncbi:MAG: ATP-binding protein [Gammaproteobacteria bacterium]|nr:ATP-binding protein [Gammaproteobacteria bacterium]